MEESEEEDKAEKSSEQQTVSVFNENTEKNNKWRADFILYGGFEHLLNIFKEFTSKDHSSLDLFDKSILSFILKIFRNYLMAALAKKVPEVYKMNQFIKLIHFSLDLISEAASPKTIERNKEEEIRKEEEGGRKEEEEKEKRQKEKEKEVKQCDTRDHPVENSVTRAALQNSYEKEEKQPKDHKEDNKQEKLGEKSKLEEKKTQLLKQKLGTYLSFYTF